MTDPFEKVKIELRSILLSSKHGVAVTDIQSDYEQLTCQRLLLKELCFADVQSLMRAIPDVAKEVRSPNGQIIYHAVCDESTAHIQKLVANQTTKNKNLKYLKGRGRGRGRGGLSRGHGVAREGRGGRANMVGYPKPNFLLASHRGRPMRSFQTSSRAAYNSNTNRSEPFNGPFRNHFNQEDDWDVSARDEHTQSLNMSRAITGRGNGAAEQVRFSEYNGVDDDNGLRRSASPICNLRIGVKASGQRVISTYNGPMGKISDGGDLNADEGVSASSTQYDLRDHLNNRRSHRTDAAAAESHYDDHGAVAGKDFHLDAMRNRRVDNVQLRNIVCTIVRHNEKPLKMKENKHLFKQNLPPRLQRKQDQNIGFVVRDRQVPASEDSPSHFSEENTIYFLDKSNWAPPENGELYLQAYYNYFSQRGERPPEITISPGKLKKQMGFYGRLIYNDKHYYPLEIMQSEDQAKQNVARSFCLKNNIDCSTVAAAEQQQKAPPKQSQFSSSASHTSPKEQHNPSVAESSSKQSQPALKSSQEPSQSKSANPEPVPASANQKQGLPEILEKIYKMLKPNGMWVSMLANLYQATYGETLTLDFLSLASQWPDFFTLDQLAGNRYTVYPVADALTRQAQASVTNEVKEESPVFVPVSQALQPPVGSEVQVLFSFAYSATDLYVQIADMENLVYEIDEMLNNNCPKNSAPELDTIMVNSLMAANYENGWYRAQVVTVETPMVIVYFVDYGNKEKVNVSDLRPIPREELTLNTPSLAIKCAVRKSKAGEWRKDVTNILTELTENLPTLSAKILEHKGDQCVIDLCTPDGRLVNDMLIQPAPAPSPHLTNTPPQKATPREQDKRQSFGSPGTKLFADDPEPLVMPECNTFAVYVCRVMSENTVLLRIVDDDYSDKLDQLEQQIAENFYNWSMPTQLKPSNIYAGMVLAGVDDADYVEFDEQGREKLSDRNKYHRVRLLKANKDGTCDCYLPDHGHDEVLIVSHLREIDPIVNLSLSYQAVMARLHGLDKLPDLLKPMAVRLLIKLLINGSAFHAVKQSKSAENGPDRSVGMDATVMNRVRKIISCMSNVEPAAVAKVYLDVYGEPLDNVEEVIHKIPGFGYWKESLVVNLIDTSQEESDVNVNEWTLAVIDDMNKVQSQGGSVEDVWRNLFSSNTSQTDTDSGSFLEEGFLGTDSLKSALINLSADQSNIDNEEKLSRVQKYVEDLTPAVQDDSTKPAASSRVLYTWSTKPETQVADASSVHTPASSPLPSLLQLSVCDNSNLPKFWEYPFLKLMSVHVVRVESPSYFVVIPMEQRGALEKLEVAIAQYYSSNITAPATSFSDEVLYAMKSQDVYHRTLFVNKVGDLVKVFLPDHHSYDTVNPSELFLLPRQFYSLPFLAHQSRLGGVIPAGHNWPAHVIHWFKNTVSNKSLYALVTRVERSSSDPRLPGTIVVRLIDTSGSEDLVVDEHMESQGMAALDPDSDL